jgi:Xaa-Pro aminopeptidase
VSTIRRRQALGATLPAELAGLLVTKLVNVRYLTGFTGSAGAVLVAPDGTAQLAVDGRYVTQARAEAPDVELLVTREGAAALARGAQTGGPIGIEADAVTLALCDRLSETGAELRPLRQPVEPLRAVKDRAELELLEQACAITAGCFDDLLGQLRPGVTEREASWALTVAMRARGADGPAFPSIVAFGPNSAIPHHQPTDRPLADGDLVKLDFGALARGYHADMTRTVICGTPADWQAELHAQVLDVQTSCRDRVVNGVTPRDLDTHARTLLAAQGHDLVHGLGHGVGLEIHESPFLSPETDADTLVDRVPVTVEPGIYLPGRGGVRIEDTVVVRGAQAQCLTTAPRELIQI